jgi:hypothetical protein
MHPRGKLAAAAKLVTDKAMIIKGGGAIMMLPLERNELPIEQKCGKLGVCVLEMHCDLLRLLFVDGAMQGTVRAASNNLRAYFRARGNRYVVV